GRFDLQGDAPAVATFAAGASDTPRATRPSLSRIDGRAVHPPKLPGVIAKVRGFSLAPLASRLAGRTGRSRFAVFTTRNNRDFPHGTARHEMNRSSIASRVGSLGPGFDPAALGVQFQKIDLDVLVASLNHGIPGKKQTPKGFSARVIPNPFGHGPIRG